jgi:hypothetical protein
VIKLIASECDLAARHAALSAFPIFYSTARALKALYGHSGAIAGLWGTHIRVSPRIYICTKAPSIAERFAATTIETLQADSRKYVNIGPTPPADATPPADRKYVKYRTDPPADLSQSRKLSQRCFSLQPRGNPQNGLGSAKTFLSDENGLVQSFPLSRIPKLAK